MLRKWVMSTQAISVCFGFCFLGWGFFLRPVAIFKCFLFLQILHLISSRLYSFWPNLCSVWVWRSKRLELGSVHVGVLANWWAIPSGCDHLDGRAVLVSTGAYCGWENRLGRGRISYCGILCQAVLQCCKKSRGFGPQGWWAELKFPLSTSSNHSWSKAWPATREKQRALTWAWVQKIAFLQGAISLFFPFIFSLIIPFFYSWHLTALAVWWGSGRSLNLGFFLFFCHCGTRCVFPLPFPVSPGPLIWMGKPQPCLTVAQ